MKKIKKNNKKKKIIFIGVIVLLILVAVITILIFGSKKTDLVLIKDLDVKTYGIDNAADFLAKDVTVQNSGADFKIRLNEKNQIIKVAIPGRFSVYNALAAIAVTQKSIFFRTKETSQGIGARQSIPRTRIFHCPLRSIIFSEHISTESLPKKRS